MASEVPLSTEHSESLYERAISRRSLLVGAAALGALAAAPALACGGKSDKDIFGDSKTASAGAATATTAASKAVSGGTLIPANGQVAINFTYAADEGGGAKNPYIAVWVETAAGDFVDTVSLWYSGGKNEQYLSDMRSWVSASGGTDKSMSSSTRTAGSYSVVWDGNDASGKKAAQGEYLMFIECARENGPYSVISEPMTIAAVASRVIPADKGEISKVSMTYTS